VSWWDGPLAAFDLETTASDPEEARIVSAALVAIGPSRLEQGEKRTVEEHAWLVNPHVEIPQEAIDVHGITNERARQQGVELAEAIAQLVVAFERMLNRGMPLVVFNARYDLTVADRELRRLGSPAIAEILTRLRVIDPMVIDRDLQKYRKGSRKLIATCEHYGAELPTAHDATFDALAAARLAWVLGKRGRVVRRCRGEDERREYIELTQEWERVRGDLDALHEWQRKAARVQAIELEEFFHAGAPWKDVPPQPDRVVPREWPIIPLSSAA
jgi:DNA polymerase-3 subunit epsilon